MTLGEDVEEAQKLTTSDHLHIGFISSGYMLQPSYCFMVQHTAEGERPSLFLCASQMEKRFITLPDSLSNTDMIKHNIK